MNKLAFMLKERAYLFFIVLPACGPVKNVSEMRDDMKGLRQDIKVMVGQIGTMSEDMKGLRSDMGTLSTTIPEMSKDMKGVRSDMQGMSSEVKNMSTQMSSMLTHISGMGQDMKGLSTQMAQMLEPMKTMEKNTSQMAAQMNTMTDAMMLVRGTMIEMGQIMGDMKNTMNDLGKKMDKMVQPIERLDSRMQEMVESVGLMREKMVGLSDQMGEMLTPMKRMDQNTTKMSDQMQNMSQQITQMAQKMTGLTEKMSEMLAPIIRMDEKFGKVATQMDGISGQMGNMSAQVTEVTAGMRSMTGLIEEMNGVISKMGSILKLTHHDLRMVFTGQHRLEALQAMIEAPDQETKLGYAAEYMTSMTYQAWNHQVDSVERRLDLMALAVPDFFFKISQFILDHDRVDPSKTDAISMNLYAISATLDYLNMIQLEGLQGSQQKPVSLYSMIVEALQAAKKIREGKAKLADYPEYIKETLSREPTAIYLLKVRQNFLKGVAYTLISNTDNGDQAKKSKSIWRVLKTRIFKTGWKADLEDRNVVQKEDIQKALHLALDTQEVLIELGIHPSTDANIRALLSRVKSDAELKSVLDRMKRLDELEKNL